ncbi:MAG: SusC/RagA family TonB-linked outer membrane protein [Longimicrobiales bacterium]
MRMSCEGFAALTATALLVLFASAPQAISAQQAVRGTVTDAQSGQPIPGAQVSVRGTNIGTIAGDDGRYLLPSVPAGRAEIRAEFIGYSPQSQTVTITSGDALTVDFEMGIAAIELEELVAAGYVEQTRREVSAAISTIEAEALDNPVIASLDAALQGRAPGVQVIQNAGNPGNGITVRIRGSSSITASNQPLYVVDGVPIFRDDFSQLGLGGQDLSAITSLNPSEIESISILKDAAAAAIYGSRGSNGVVLITTKRGTAGAPRISVSVYGGTQEASRTIDVLNTEQWLEYMSAGMRLDGYSEDEINDQFGFIDPSVETDWQAEVLREAPITNTQVDISGGTERFNYFVSGAYFDQTGIIIGSEYDRASGRANLDFQASDRLNVSASLSLTQEDNDRIESDNSIESAVTNAIANEPWAPVFEDDGTYSGAASYANPVAIGLENAVEARTLRGLGNIAATYEVLPWLHGTVRGAFDMLDLREYEYQSPLVPFSIAAGVDGVAQIGNSQGRKYLLEGLVTADRFFGVHEISLTAGSSIEMTDRELSFVRGEGFTSPDLQFPANAANVTSYDGTAWEHNLVSYFGRANYTFADRYIINASLRTDGSSRFGPNTKYGVFPAISGAWVISGEPFMEAVDLVTDLKLRASWGETGNEAIGDFQFLGLYGTANYGDIPGTAPSNPANPDLQWETTREWNVGMDASFLGDRIGLIAELYSKETEALLLDRPVSATFGFTEITANVGTIQNEGWELNLRTVNVRARGAGGFEWTTDFNVTHNENLVTALFSPDPSAEGEPFDAGFYNRVAVGQPLGFFFAARYEGVDPETGNALFSDLDADGNRIGTTMGPGAEDRTFVGSPHPDYFGGFRNMIRWGGFDLLAFVEYSQGAEIFNAMREFADDGGFFFDNKFSNVMDYWTPENTDASQPRPSWDGVSGARFTSSRWVEDGSYVRLGEVTLGYQLPAGLADAIGSSNARLYVSGTNLHTWTDYSGYAPDVNSFGSGAEGAALGTDFYPYPLARTWTIGFQGTW